ncbi:hypothetical protein BTN49_2925 [Candidatus Enterovibrio escicola]|uniref:Uncharacterized protein n=1 Tax=Candidatus Enterovibrio escicola TaxID=1927127 RepID=A0A2A5SZR3_9GAMM|nr:hypothetical protein BTN49_2925 [Candidatus Enterovibrio escacola]
MQCIPCWLLVWQDQSTGYTALFPTHIPEITIVLGCDSGKQSGCNRFLSLDIQIDGKLSLSSSLN